MKTFTATILFFLLNFFGYSQAVSQRDKISTAVSNYFSLDRETIYIHFDKTTFLTNEKIWFKGYVFNKKDNTPFFVTTNVYAVLFNEKGEKINEKLLFASGGTFSGNFKLNEDNKSGRYHIQFYTNWMNNFAEDESAIYKIDVINHQESFIVDTETVDYSIPAVSFQAEGGHLIKGIINNVGVVVQDCNWNSLGVKEGQILNEKKEVVATFVLTNSGFGKFYLKPTFETYTAVITINQNATEFKLPKAEMSGVALEVNNYALAGKTIIKLRTNPNTAELLAGKPIYVTIQQNDKANLFEAVFSTTLLEQEFALPYDNFL